MAGRSKSRAPIAVPGIGLDLDVEFDREAEGAGIRIWRGLRRQPGFWVGAIAIVILVTLAATASFISPYNPNFAIRGSGLAANGDPLGPTFEFPLGTDRLGRDYLSRLLHGARTSLIVGIGATFAASLLGAAVGGTAAFVGTAHLSIPVGRRRLNVRLPVETLLMRLTDVVLSLPALLLAIALVAVMGPSLLLVLIVIGGLLWTATARMVYSRVRLLRELEFVDAARALGASNVRILLRHIAPHLASLVVVYATLTMAAAVLAEATLSFLGVGVPPPAASWGTMIVEHAGYFRTDPRLLVLPGLGIMITVLAFNLLGDALRDALDPRTGR